MSSSFSNDTLLRIANLKRSFHLQYKDIETHLERLKETITSLDTQLRNFAAQTEPKEKNLTAKSINDLKASIGRQTEVIEALRVQLNETCASWMAETDVLDAAIADMNAAVEQGIYGGVREWPRGVGKCCEICVLERRWNE